MEVLGKLMPVFCGSRFLNIYIPYTSSDEMSQSIEACIKNSVGSKRQVALGLPLIGGHWGSMSPFSQPNIVQGHQWPPDGPLRRERESPACGHPGPHEWCETTERLPSLAGKLNCSCTLPSWYADWWALSKTKSAVLRGYAVTVYFHALASMRSMGCFSCNSRLSA